MVGDRPYFALNLTPLGLQRLASARSRQNKHLEGEFDGGASLALAQFINEIGNVSIWQGWVVSRRPVLFGQALLHPMGGIGPRSKPQGMRPV